MSLVADVFDVLLIDPNTDETVGTTTLQDAGIEFTMESTDVRAGQKNQLIAILHSNRDIAINMTDVEFKYSYLARQMGQDITTGSGVAYKKPEWFSVEDLGTSQPGITLSETPLDSDNGLAVYTEDGQRITGFVLSADEIDFSAATPTVDTGDNVEVRTYKFETSADTEIIEFDIEKIPTNLICVLETAEINEEEEMVATLQYQFDKCAPDGNFSINTTSAREANTTAVAMRVLKPKTSTVVGRALRIPVTTP